MVTGAVLLVAVIIDAIARPAAGLRAGAGAGLHAARRADRLRPGRRRLPRPVHRGDAGDDAGIGGHRESGARGPREPGAPRGARARGRGALWESPRRARPGGGGIAQPHPRAAGRCGLEAGMHVVVDKPLAARAADGRRLIADGGGARACS